MQCLVCASLTDDGRLAATIFSFLLLLKYGSELLGKTIFALIWKLRFIIHIFVLNVKPLHLVIHFYGKPSILWNMQVPWLWTSYTIITMCGCGCVCIESWIMCTSITVLVTSTAHNKKYLKRTQMLRICVKFKAVHPNFVAINLLMVVGLWRWRRWLSLTRILFRAARATQCRST